MSQVLLLLGEVTLNVLEVWYVRSRVELLVRAACVAVSQFASIELI